MVRTKDTRSYNEDDNLEEETLTGEDMEEDLEDDEQPPKYEKKPVGKSAIAKPQPSQRRQPEQSDEVKMVEVEINMKLLNDKLNYLMAQNNEIIQMLKR